MAACVHLKNGGHEPIYQLTCRDRNRIALQWHILTAYSPGIDNMLLITGDHIKLGDHKQAKPVFDIDSVQLIKLAVGLREGHDSVAEEDRKKKAAEMMGRFIREIKSMVQGVHVMPLGWTDIVPQILEHAEIKINKI